MLQTRCNTQGLKSLARYLGGAFLRLYILGFWCVPVGMDFDRIYKQVQRVCNLKKVKKSLNCLIENICLFVLYIYKQSKNYNAMFMKRKMRNLAKAQSRSLTLDKLIEWKIEVQNLMQECEELIGIMIEIGNDEGVDEWFHKLILSDELHDIIEAEFMKR